jgi:hypothetical protein
VRLLLCWVSPTCCCCRRCNLRQWGSRHIRLLLLLLPQLLLWFLLLLLHGLLSRQYLLLFLCECAEGLSARPAHVPAVEQLQHQTVTGAVAIAGYHQVIQQTRMEHCTPQTRNMTAGRRLA